MTVNSRDKSHFLAGCSRKIGLVLLVILGSGLVGWLIGKAWVGYSGRSNPEKMVFATAESSSNSDTGREWQRKAQIKNRRNELGIDGQFFSLLVNEVFSRQYPDRPTNKVMDLPWREKKDRVALDLLDRLATLDPMVRKGLGTYDRPQLQQWKQQINELHLGGRILNILADSAFFATFPEQTDRPSLDTPLGQVWGALALTRLQSLQSGQSYQQIDRLAAGGEYALEGVTGGNAYAIELRSGDNLTLNLETDGDVSLYLYSPTGNMILMENSSDYQWSGKLPEAGFYELAIVSKSLTPLNFRLSFQVTH